MARQTRYDRRHGGQFTSGAGSGTYGSGVSGVILGRLAGGPAGGVGVPRNPSSAITVTHDTKPQGIFTLCPRIRDLSPQPAPLYASRGPRRRYTGLLPSLPAVALALDTMRHPCHSLPMPSSSPRTYAGSKNDISQWWLKNRLPDLRRLFEDEVPEFEELTGTCWACWRWTGSTERCHLIPHSLGGTEERGNIVLLCNACHRDAPSVNDDGSTMLTWVADRTPWLSEMLGDIVEIAKDFDQEALAAFCGREDSAAVLDQTMKHLFRNVEVHGNRLSRSSRRWAIRQAYSLFVEMGLKCGISA